MEHLKLKKAAEYIGYNPIYLQSLDRRGILAAHRTATGRRYYLKSDLDAFLNATPKKALESSKE